MVQEELGEDEPPAADLEAAQEEPTVEEPSACSPPKPSPTTSAQEMLKREKRPETGRTWRSNWRPRLGAIEKRQGAFEMVKILALCINVFMFFGVHMYHVECF